MKSALSDIGITLTFRVLAHSTYHAQIRKDVDPIACSVAFRPNADA